MRNKHTSSVHVGVTKKWIRLGKSVYTGDSIEQFPSLRQAKRYYRTGKKS